MSLVIGQKKKLAPLFLPIRCKTKTNYELVARIFPRFSGFDRFYIDFSLAYKVSFLSSD